MGDEAKTKGSDTPAIRWLGVDGIKIESGYAVLFQIATKNAPDAARMSDAKEA